VAATRDFAHAPTVIDAQCNRTGRCRHVHGLTLME
jgi:hypothetical protein